MSEKTNHEDPQMEVEDEFQPDFVVPDIENHCDDEAENPKVLIIQSDDIIAKDTNVGISDKSPEKVIHINTRSDTSKPSISGLKVSSVQGISKTVLKKPSSGNVFLCPDPSCKLRLPSKSSLKTHIVMCHTRGKDVKVIKEDIENNEEDCLGDDLDIDDVSDSEGETVMIKNKSGIAKVKIKECSICSYIAKNAADLKRHIKSIHEEAKTYQCKECNITVTRKYHLLRHIKAVHERERFWQCESCEYKTNNFSCFKKHKHNKHVSGGDCDIKYSVDYLQNLPPGVKEADLKCVCTWCPFKSAQYKVVKKHIEIHHERKKHFPCKECVFVGESVDDYAKHYTEFHKTDDYPHACTDCTFKCTNKHDLKQHYLTEHSKQKLYVCKTCNHRSSDVNNMKRHIMTVHPSMFKCDYCDYESESKDELFTHQYNDHGLHIADINADDMKVVIINDDEHTIYTTA